MSEEIFIEDYDLTPGPEDKKKPKRTLTVSDVLFGPKDVQLQGDSFLAAGKLGRRIKERITGEDLTPIKDVDPFTGFVAGVVDATIKIPYGVANITAEIMDAMEDENLPVDKSSVAKLEKYFADTVFGKIQQGLFEVCKRNAFIYIQALYLMKHTVRTRRNGFVAEHPAWRKGTNRRCMGFHMAHLNR